MLFTKLAVAINENAVDPTKLDDAFMAKGTESVVAACKAASPPASEADLKAFRSSMGDWSTILDRKLSDIKRAGAAD